MSLSNVSVMQLISRVTGSNKKIVLEKEEYLEHKKFTDELEKKQHLDNNDVWFDEIDELDINFQE